jgi:hypothetical protein
VAYALLPQFLAIRRSSTPLAAILTADMPATVQALGDMFHAFDKENDCLTPLLQWDMVRGLQVLSSARGSQQVLGGLANKAQTLTNPVELLRGVGQLAEHTVLLCHNLHLFLAQPGVIQALANLREPCKAQHQLVVLLCPALTLPPELRQDILVLEEALPDQPELQRIVTAEYAAFQDATGTSLPALEGRLVDATDALRGLSHFAAEQEVAMALSPAGLDVTQLWRRKRQVIAQTNGLTWYDGREGFEAIGGYTALRTFLQRLITGVLHIKVILWVDELEKQMAGAQGDNTGVSQYLHSALLTYMAERQMVGTLLLGMPGVGKSLIAKTVGVETQTPTLMLDLGATKQARVGESEANIRAVFKTVDVLAGAGHVLLIATCNALEVLSPELRRRFQLGGSWICDIPDDDERLAIWQIHLAKYPALKGQKVPIDAAWTGADIAQCTRLAWAMGITLHEAAAYIVPVTVSAAERVDTLRREAAGRYLSASYGGVYHVPDDKPHGREYTRR